MLKNLISKRKAKALAELATTRYDAGDLAEAAALGRRALELDGNQNVAHNLLVQIALPGMIYGEVLRALHAHLAPRTYIEIGIRHGDSLALARPDTRAIGIDPAPELRHSFGKLTKIFRETSDDFFAKHDVRAELGGLPVDLAFIDGMHKFEFALRDFINLEKHAASTGTILVHDCYPFDEITARRDRVTDFWSGDIWRLIVALKEYRPDLEVHTIGTPPTGLGCIRRLDPTSTVLADNYDRIVADLLARPYEQLAGNKDDLLGLVPNEWSKIEALVSTSP